MDALFLYWLMEKAGGFSFSNEAIVDLGGLQFIKDSISYYGTGWTYLQEKFGKDISRLLTEFAMEITEFPFSSIEVYIIKDPYTQEPLTIHPYMGVVQSPQVPGKTYTFNGPAIKPFTTSWSVLPLSCTFLQPWLIQIKTIGTIAQTSGKGQAWLGLYMK